MDNTTNTTNITNSSRHIDSAINSRNTEPADIPALNKAGDVWGKLSPGNPGPNKYPNLRNTGGTARSPSSHPSHHDKVVDETPSVSKVNGVIKQPTKPHTAKMALNSSKYRQKTSSDSDASKTQDLAKFEGLHPLEGITRHYHFRSDQSCTACTALHAVQPGTL
jgi:hypothetical protein